MKEKNLIGHKTRKRDHTKVIKVLTLVFAQLILPPPGQRYNADGYILSPVQNVFRPTPPFPLAAAAAARAQALERSGRAQRGRVSIDYLVGRTSLVLDKATLKRLEDINALPAEAKEYVLNHIDIMIRDFKNKKAYSHK